ncbi:CHAT domain-containing protein [Streptomyces sp. NPDC053367]|uniref:CHAT domain-containing protein n=1 Tax=Streptomyces sp. NPDC053367 TaxID=3365700 RepID=UPI0037CE31D9
MVAQYEEAVDSGAIDGVIELVREIHAGHLSLDTAESRVRSPQWQLTEQEAAVLVSVGLRQVHLGIPESGYLLARLILAAAEERWGRTHTSPWWGAADLLVEAVRLDLVERPSGNRLRLACSIADEQIATLRELGELEEMADTMYAAGILRIHPHTGRPVTHDDPSSFRERQVRGLIRSQFYSGEITEDEESLDNLPHPVDAALEALPYLYGAAGLSQGHLRARCLNAVNEALSLLMQEPDPQDWMRDAWLANSRAAAELLDPAKDPVNWTRLRRILVALDGQAPPTTLDEALPMPVSELVERFGKREAGAVTDQVLCLLRETGNREALRQVVAAVHAELTPFPEREHMRETWESQVHVLPGDPLPCPDDTLSPEDFSGLLAEVADDPERQTAARLHMAAHLYHGRDPRAAHRLVRDADLYTRNQPPEVGEAVIHLLGSTAARAAVAHREDSALAEAINLHAEAARHYGTLGLRDLALRELELLVSCAYEGSTSDAIRAAVLLRIAVAPWLDTALFEESAFALNMAAQRLAAAMAVGSSSPGALLLLMAAAKGLDFSRALTGRGPRQPAPVLDELLHRIDDLERRSGAAGAPRLHEIGEDLEMLCYAGSRESAHGDADAELLSNLRRSFDRRLSRRLYGLERSTELSQHPTLDDVTAALPADTVLISLFIGLETSVTAPKDSDGKRSAALYLVTVTQEGVQDVRVRNFDGVPGGVIKIGKEGYLHTMHPFAYQVDSIRSAVRADPLHGVVTWEGEEELDFATLFGDGLADVLARLHGEGKRHLCFWGHGPFHFLPFPLLQVGGKPLADDWTVSTVPSLVCVTEPGQDASRTGTGLISLGAALGGTPWRLRPEPVLDEHAVSVARSAEGQALVGPDATPASLLARAQGARYVHVAAHGSHSPEASWFQCLYLNPPAEGGDGRLFGHDVLAADLRGVDMVTLSACESGLGRFDSADNLRGLPAAFLLAGARAVVGCLWPVRTETATCFFGELYQHLVLRHDTLGAFRHAQNVTRARFPEYRDWGAFVYQGGWTRPDERNV